MFCSLIVLVIEARVSSCLGVVLKTHGLGVVPKPRHGKEFIVVHLGGPKAPLVTSWTKDNPGKRFNGCGLYKVRNNVYRGSCYDLFVDYFLLFWTCRLQV